MMTDVSGFSRMMGTDEEKTVELIKEFHQRVRALVEQFEGRVVDTAGDSVFGEFDSVVNAVRCARRIQEEQAERNERHPPEERIDTRIGVHLGDVIVEDYRVYGDGVNIAARLEPIADPGGICISEAVYQQVRNKLDVPVEELGLRELKNIEHPIRVYKVLPVKPAGSSVSSPAPAGASPATASAAPAARTNAPSHEYVLPHDEIDTALRTWVEEIARAGMLVPLAVALFLLMSPTILFSTGGVLPTGGAILAGICFGRAWARRSGRRGNFLIALGFAIASGAFWTDWSRVTNGLFVLGGLIVAAAGVGGRRRPAPRV
jgi:hypothetical protein